MSSVTLAMAIAFYRRLLKSVTTKLPVTPAHYIPITIFVEREEACLELLYNPDFEAEEYYEHEDRLAIDDDTMHKCLEYLIRLCKPTCCYEALIFYNRHIQY